MEEPNQTFLASLPANQSPTKSIKQENHPTVETSGMFALRVRQTSLVPTRTCLVRATADVFQPVRSSTYDRIDRILRLQRLFVAFHASSFLVGLPCVDDRREERLAHVVCVLAVGVILGFYVEHLVSQGVLVQMKRTFVPYANVQ